MEGTEANGRALLLQATGLDSLREAELADQPPLEGPLASNTLGFTNTGAMREDKSVEGSMGAIRA
jgi:hypothetical protein